MGKSASGYKTTFVFIKKTFNHINRTFSSQHHFLLTDLLINNHGVENFKLKQLTLDYYQSTNPIIVRVIIIM